MVDQGSLSSLPTNSNGQWVKGQSGNPAGRPRGRRLAELQKDLEIAVRETLDPKRIAGIIEKIATMAEAGDVKAAKLILDKTISNAQAGESDNQSDGRTVIFRIENATFTKQPEVPPAIEVKVIETQVSTETKQPTEAKHE